MPTKQKLDTVDTNIKNYSTEELLRVLDLEIDNPNKEDMIKASNKYIQKFKNEENEIMAKFFQDMQKRLTLYIDQLPALNRDAQKQIENWYQNINLEQKDDLVQKDKVTDRFQKIDVFDDPYNIQQMPYKRKELGVANIKTVDVQQDKLNPNLQNTITRIVNIDSKYRQGDGLSSHLTSTQFSIDLSETLVNVLSMKIYTIQIPQTWYAIDTVYGNTCFFISFYNNSTSDLDAYATITLEPGNYNTVNGSNTNIVTYLTASFATAGFTFSSGTAPVSYNHVNGKITLNLYGGTYTDSSTGTIYTVDSTTVITFFDPSGQYTCGYSCGQTFTINSTLGWILGFRVPLINVIQSGNTGIAVVDLYGPRYLMLIIDDLNQNHINNGVVVISQFNKTLKLPTYYSPDLPYVCNDANPLGTSLLAASNELQNNQDVGILLADKFDANYTKTVTLLPSAPRTLTQAQLYSINEIMKNNSMNDNYRLQAPTHSDLLAIIPLAYKTNTTGELILVDSSTLQLNKRTYFGPVNIERMNVQLMDDRGNLLNLNGVNWSVTLIVECLYQY
jgi:hypothetical protein